MSKKTIYYSDELNDDFSGVVRNTKVIDDKYKYIKKNLIWKLFEFIVYRVFIVPFAFVYIKIKFHHKGDGRIFDGIVLDGKARRLFDRDIQICQILTILRRSYLGRLGRAFLRSFRSGFRRECRGAFGRCLGRCFYGG